VVVEAADRGLTPVLDARVLPGGRMALALGGAGVAILHPDGRPLFSFDVPAQRIVPADHGGRLLAIRQTVPGQVTVWVLDLVGRRHTVFGEIPADLWAGSYDGANWFVAAGPDLWMLDLIADGPAAIWKLEETGGPIVALSRSATALSVGTLDWGGYDKGHQVVRTHYDLPSFRATGKQVVPFGPDHGLLPTGDTRPGAVDGDLQSVVTRVAGPEHSVAVTLLPRSGVGSRLFVHQLRLEGVGGCSAWLDHGVLVTGDELGRIERYDRNRKVRLPSVRTTI
jgi:hypothetical protein